MNFHKLFLTTIAVLSVPSLAHAEEVFQWAAPHTQFSATFPDDWRQISNQQPDDVLTIAGPGENDFATCRLRMDQDRRFLIYPREDAAAVQHKNYSNNFWNDYMGQFNGAVLNEGHDDAGLGQGFATYADISFVSDAGPTAQKRGIMLASVYNDKRYVFECSSETTVFPQWQHTFLDILKSVDMRVEYSPYVNGYYRDFQDDPGLRIAGERYRIDDYIY